MGAAIRITGSDKYVRSRQAWGRGDYVQLGYVNAGMKKFATTNSARQWLNRYRNSILPDVFNRITLGEAQSHGLLEIVIID